MDGNAAILIGGLMPLVTIVTEEMDGGTCNQSEAGMKTAIEISGLASNPSGLVGRDSVEP